VDDFTQTEKLQRHALAPQTALFSLQSIQKLNSGDLFRLHVLPAV